MDSLGPADVIAAELDLWVVSHGGVGSNALTDHLVGQGVRTRPANYRLICHKQHPGKPVGVPILVLYGDYANAIRSMARRGFVRANASKLHFGIDSPEIALERFVDSFPDDPIGIKAFLKSFDDARATGLDRIEFVVYPFELDEVQAALQRLSARGEVGSFVRKERRRARVKETAALKAAIEPYLDWSFTPRSVCPEGSPGGRFDDVSPLLISQVSDRLLF